MRTLRKYTGFPVKIHSFALILSFLFSYATPQIPAAFAQESSARTKALRAPLTPEAVEGEYIVAFKTDKTLKNIDKGTKPTWLKKLGNGVEIDTSLRNLNIAQIRVSNPTSTGQWENLANIMSSDPDIQTVEPNYFVYANKTPNDPLIQHQWFLNSIKAYEAWDIPTEKKDVIVAVIDTGIQVTHEDLKGRIWINRNEKPDNNTDDDKNGFIDDMIGWNFYENNNLPMATYYPKAKYTSEGRCVEDKTADAFETHGSHVAGLIGAVNDNARGIAGIASRIKIMPIKALGGSCGRAPVFSTMKAALYAYKNGASIINMSFSSFGKSDIAKRTYEFLSREGVLMIAAAGNQANDNDSSTRAYPASYLIHGIVSVAASTPEDTLADFSNYGARNVDLAAPGVAILAPSLQAHWTHQKVAMPLTPAHPWQRQLSAAQLL